MTTSGGYGPRRSPGRRQCSPARGAAFRKPPADAREQAIADLAIGLKLLLAIAFGSGRILGRPVFDVGGGGPCQVQRLVVRLGRERDDEVEVKAFPVLQILEGHRLV